MEADRLKDRQMSAFSRALARLKAFRDPRLGHHCRDQ
jgi:hypothetical protein